MIITMQGEYLPHATYFHIHDTHRVVLKKNSKKKIGPTTIYFYIIIIS